MGASLLWVLALIIGVIGVVEIIQGQILIGVLLIVVACLVGPGGVSIAGRRRSRF